MYGSSMPLFKQGPPHAAVVSFLQTPVSLVPFDGSLSELLECVQVVRRGVADVEQMGLHLDGDDVSLLLYLTWIVVSRQFGGGSSYGSMTLLYSRSRCVFDSSAGMFDHLFVDTVVSAALPFFDVIDAKSLSNDTSCTSSKVFAAFLTCRFIRKMWFTLLTPRLSQTKANLSEGLDKAEHAHVWLL